MEARRMMLRPVNRNPRVPLNATPAGGTRVPGRVWRPSTPKEVKGVPSRILAKEEKEELLRKLTPMQYRVTQEKLTERPYSNQYYKHWERGVYCCVVCGEEVFLSHAKYDSGSGWPAFYDIISKDKVTLKQDLSHVGANLLLLVCNPSLARTEVSCSTCNAHLGHMFEDGPKPTGKRFCVNSSALVFKAKQGRPEELNTDEKMDFQNGEDGCVMKSTSCAVRGVVDQPLIHLASPTNSCALGARLCFVVSNMDTYEATPNS